MGWRELQAWLAATNRQLKGPELKPDSWQGYDQDAWYQEKRRERDEARRQR